MRVSIGISDASLTRVLASRVSTKRRRRSDRAGAIALSNLFHRPQCVTIRPLPGPQCSTMKVYFERPHATPSHATPSKFNFIIAKSSLLSANSAGITLWNLEPWKVCVDSKTVNHFKNQLRLMRRLLNLNRKPLPVSRY